MKSVREPVTFQFEGPLSGRNTPGTDMYDAVLQFQHSANGSAWNDLETTISKLAGPAKQRRFPKRLEWNGKWNMQARIRGKIAQLRFGSKVRDRPLQKLLSALEAVPGASQLRIEGKVESFIREGDDVGPCSPCAAKRL